ncbi:NERD domain-containing protein [Cryobacterium sinapicolor]|uniref:NERD domain-containing protein n=1 Tax=Cryobacterium sinapicolor TaxID=1259236 RepID=A0ABY2IWD1_9MICO|nr:MULTISPECIES: nuclease-related domain-containing protein [Cryobacterium]TFC93187.1 NERD domain-containing protein [Cryobacterium sp. TMT3-29-2]TFC94298.1 NERD domain-containing protein [Cryobacterium sinapicolor]
MAFDSATMQGSFEAQSVDEQLLRVQGCAPRRPLFARFFGRPPLGVDSMSWYRGAEGEIVVGTILASLPPEWTALHAVPIDCPNAATDHLVIGPGGIFTITTKRHPIHDIRVARDSLQIDGESVPYLRNAEYEAERITNLVRERMPLVAPVQPVLVFVEPGLLTIEQKPQQVKVLDAQDLRRWLVRLHPVLSAGEVQEVADLLDSPNVWRALPDTPPDDLREPFPALYPRVPSVGRRRMLWGLIAAAGTALAGYAVFQLVQAALATA